MHVRNVKTLHPGDQVFWQDPDGTCSRVYTILTITVDSKTGIVSIQEPDGSYLECFSRELKEGL